MLLKLIKSAFHRPEPPGRAQALALEHYRRGELEQAERHFRAAAREAPGDVTAWSNLAATLVRLQRHEAAIPVLEHLVELAPALAEAHLDLGLCCSRTGDNAAAVGHYRQAIALKPELHTAHANLLAAHLESCDWDAVDRWRTAFDAYRAEQPAAQWSQRMEPFCALALYDADVCKAIARERAQRIARENPPLPAVPSWRHARIRVGYVSADFYNHATAHLTGRLYELHDRGAFEICAYSTGPDDGSIYRRRIAAGCDHFVDVRAESSQRIAQRIREDEIDILVDMKGYTANGRPEIFACRPAPVQVAYLGYPGTTGAACIDYFVTDRVATPPECEIEFTERLVFLPDAYQANDDRQPIAADCGTRAQAGLPDDAFVYCSFNRLGKIDRTVFAAWMRILQRVPHGVLWLLREDPAAVANLQRAAAASGIDPGRLVFADKIEKSAHLARHRLADLFLDTYACNAHTGAADALWAGLPLLTCPRTTFATRVAASLLSAAGLPELVARDLDDYTQRAVELAQDPAALEALKQRLAAGRSSCALFDAPRYVRHLEAAYRAMQERRDRGLPPAALTVTPAA